MNNNIMQFIQQVQQFRQNPEQLKQMLYQNGKISQEQFEAIQGMNNFDEIGKYLIDNNIIPNSQLPQLQQQAQQLSSLFK